MAFEEYSRQLADRGKPEYVMSRSDLVDFNACPHKWRWGRGEEGTAATEWGSLFDMLVLHPNDIESCVSVCPETYRSEKGEEKPWTFSAKVCKEWRENQRGKVIVKAETFTQANNATKFFWGRPELAAMVRCSRKQVMVEGSYKDKDTGAEIPLRCLIDCVPDKDNEEYRDSLGDVKTTTNATPHVWGREVFKWGLHVQAALYLDLYNRATGENRETFRHLISESSPPWEPGSRILSADFVTLGRLTYIGALERYAQCLKSGKWPGYEVDSAGLMWQGWLVTQPEAWMVSSL
ncbi:MAG: PD-(D/E)XK nuclease-like domain-containing protein [Phycisphaerales bacterium]